MTGLVRLSDAHKNLQEVEVNSIPMSAGDRQRAKPDVRQALVALCLALQLEGGDAAGDVDGKALVPYSPCSPWLTVWTVLLVMVVVALVSFLLGRWSMRGQQKSVSEVKTSGKARFPP